jgi:cytoskeletal protein CcmA (bactofilin family)
MKKYLQTAGASTLIILIMVLTISLNTQNVSASIKGEEITYSDGATILKGYVAYNEEQEGKKIPPQSIPK